MNEELLQKQIEEQRNLLSTDRLDLSFGEIIRMYQDGDIIIRPVFQRYFRWDIEQRTRFIESLLLGIPTPPIFVAADGKGVWELIDGLQRISTVLSFFGILKAEDEGIKKQNGWKLADGDIVSELHGFSCETIPEYLKRNLKRATCRVEILNWSVDYEMRFELFKRLNTKVTPLTEQEIRNGIYRNVSSGSINDFLTELAGNSDFIELTHLSTDLIEKLYQEELVLRFISLYKNKENIYKNLSHHMNNFMIQSLYNNNFNYEKYKDIFIGVFSLLKPLGKDIFRKIGNRKGGKFIPSVYDIITIGVAENYDYYKIHGFEVIQERILANTDNIDYVVKNLGGNNQASKIIQRLNEAQRIFGNQNS